MSLQFQMLKLHQPYTHSQRMTAIIGLGWVVFLVCSLALLATLLLQTWQLGGGIDHWLTYYEIIIVLGLFFIPALRFIWQGINNDWRYDRYHFTLFDEAMGIPLADPQPEPLPETETLAQSEWYGRVGYFRRSYSRQERWALRQYSQRGSLLFGFVFLVCMLGYLRQDLFAPAIRHFGFLQSALSLLGPLWLLIFVIITNLLSATDFRIDGIIKRRLIASADGLQWGKNRIGWREIRGFYCYQEWNPIIESMEPVSYRVDGDGIILYWFLPRSRRFRVYDVSERLAQFIVAYSMLPLRDLTPYSANFRANGNDPARFIAARKAEGVDTTELEALWLPQKQLFTPHQRRARIAYSAILFAPLIALIVLSVLGETVMQPRYFAALPSAVQARSPLFADSLAHANHQWPITTTASFASNAYHLHTDSFQDLPLTALSSRSFGDVAVHVTVSGEDYRAGVILRSDAQASHYLMFGVDTAGNPNLEWCPSKRIMSYFACDYLLSSFDVGFKRPNNLSSVVSHDLLLLSRDRSWVYYVDGVFVGSYHDNLGQLPTHGRVGLFSLFGISDVAFTNFAVYPIDTTFPWGY